MICTVIFIEALFKIVQLETTPMFINSEWINTLCYIHTLDYHPATHLKSWCWVKEARHKRVHIIPLTSSANRSEWQKCPSLGGKKKKSDCLARKIDKGNRVAGWGVMGMFSFLIVVVVSQVYMTVKTHRIIHFIFVVKYNDIWHISSRYST